MIFDKKILVLDIETESLTPQWVWVICTHDWDTGEKKQFRFVHSNREAFQEYIRDYDVFVAHNGIDFDGWVLRELGIITSEQYQSFFDTLIVSQLLDQQRRGGHSIASFGEQFKIPKSTFSDFSGWSTELEERCHGDVELNVKILEYFKEYIIDPDWTASIELEMRSAFLCRQREANGFAFDIEPARTLLKEVTKEVQLLEDQLQVDFPPVSRLVREITPQLTKSGTLNLKDFRWLVKDTPDSTPLDLTPFSGGSSFSLVEFIPFNPRSAPQRIDKLWAAGWKPYEKTKGYNKCLRKLKDLQRNRQPVTPELQERLSKYETYGWTISLDNLNTLPRDAPASAHRLKEFLVIQSRKSTLTSWIDEYNPTTGRIHGRFRTLGSWTHRKSHNHPNMANIPSGLHDDNGVLLWGREGMYGADMRKLWIPDPKDPDLRLLGCDADAIQLVVLAHYMEDPVFTYAVESGSKETGDDPHTLNWDALGRDVCRDRDVAKTFIYAWLLGAAIPKISAILSATSTAAKGAVDNFLEKFPKLKWLKTEEIPAAAQKGFFLGLDGRKVLCNNTHKMLAGYLQNGESIIMKTADVLWQAEATRRQIPYLAVDDVHDEWQTEVHKNFAEELGQLQADSISKAGRVLGLKCKVDGSYSIGLNWMETH